LISDGEVVVHISVNTSDVYDSIDIQVIQFRIVFFQTLVSLLVIKIFPNELVSDVIGVTNLRPDLSQGSNLENSGLIVRYKFRMLIVKNLDSGELPLRIVDTDISSGGTGRDNQ
jgi:hypothetical protein